MHLSGAGRACVALLLTLQCGACASPLARPAPPQTGKPPVISEHDALPAPVGERLIEQSLEGRAADPHVQALIDAFRSASDAPLVAGNRITLLLDGPQALGAMRRAILAAQRFIHVEMYIFAEDEVGREFRDLLIARRRQGVEVRVLYDAVGSLDTSEEFFAPLREAGGHALAFQPLNPTRTPLWRANNRDHRKLVLVDGRTAFTGGVNISATYAQSSATRPGRERGREEAWRDTHVQIDGPAAAEFQRLFEQTWRRVGGEFSSAPEQYTPAIDAAGPDLVAAVASTGGDEEVRVYAVYRAIVERASQRLWLTQAYFAPDEALGEALIAAARRGVDVRLIAPGFTDSALVFHAGRSTYEELLAGGVRIYEQRHALLHAKTLTVDGALSIIGSANFDMRSFLHNNEVNAVIVGADVARAMEQVFESDLQRAQELTLEQWRKRPWLEKLKELGSRLFIYWL